MSRVGKLPIEIPSGVDVSIDGLNVKVKGGKNELSTRLTGDVTVEINDGKVQVNPANDTKKARSMWGTARAIINNMIVGVTEGFSRKMEIQGTGYRAAVQGNILNLFLGHSHEIKFAIPEGISVNVEKNTITVSGHDKQQVGQVAAEIWALRKPEPYKGKGVILEGKPVIRKEGKKK